MNKVIKLLVAVYERRQISTLSLPFTGFRFLLQYPVSFNYTYIFNTFQTFQVYSTFLYKTKVHVLFMRHLIPVLI